MGIIIFLCHHIGSLSLLFFSLFSNWSYFGRATGGEDFLGLSKNKRNYSGVGFVITPPLVLVDLDNSYDRATQSITNPQAQAQEILQELKSYTEASPTHGVICHVKK